MRFELAQPDAGDAGHRTTQLGGGSPGNHAVHDGPEKGDPGGIGLPVPSVPSEVRPLATGEVPQSGQGSEQGAQEVTQARCELPGSPTLHGFERRGYGMCAAIRPGAHQAIPRAISQLEARCDKTGSEARCLMSSPQHRGFHAMIGALPRGYSGHIELPVATKDAPAT